MTTLAAPNVASRNRLECFALYVLLQACRSIPALRWR